MIETLTYNDLVKKLKDATALTATFQDFTTGRDFFINNPETVKAAISTLKVADLKKMVYCYLDEKKDRLVKKVYDNFLSSFNFSDSMQYQPFSETWEQALQRVYNSQTEEQHAAWIAKRTEKIQARSKALENPETLEEFRTFLMYRQKSDLTPEQRARYEELTADSQIKRDQINQAYKSEVKAVQIGDVDMEIKETIHTKKNIPLFVVVLSSRVERSKYDELNSRAKKLGGYYSSYNKGGAIPGFTFEKKEQAELFVKVDETVNTSELKQQAREEKKLSRADQLRAKADELEAAGNEELSRERLANTARRARFADSAERKATRQIEFAKLLRSVANGIEAGTIKYLSNLSAITELEQIESALNIAKYRHARALNINSDRYEISIETAEFIEYPFPVVYSANVLMILEKCKNRPGKKLAAARMEKRLNGREFITINTEQAIEDYKMIFLDGIGYEFDRYKEMMQQYNRMQRMEIKTVEQLRSAAREVITLKQGATLTEDQKRDLEIRNLERSFLNKKIDGFFPTPSALANSVCYLADIQPTDTVLEPSAGLGHLAEAIEARNPAQLICVEQYQPLAAALKLKGFETINADFLTADLPKFDKIVMNPPFENLQDIDHVLRAYELLKPGGRLVSIMAANKQGERQKIKDFMQFVEENGYHQENPAGSFASAFRPTGVGTITVVLDKPSQAG